MSLIDLQERIVAVVTRAYGQMFDMVAGDVDARNRARRHQGKSVFYDQQIYEKALRRNWVPLIQSQMTGAVELTADVFQSAFIEAKRPPLHLLVP